MVERVLGKDKVPGSNPGVGSRCEQTFRLGCARTRPASQTNAPDAEDASWGKSVSGEASGTGTDGNTRVRQATFVPSPATRRYLIPTADREK